MNICKLLKGQGREWDIDDILITVLIQAKQYQKRNVRKVIIVRTECWHTCNIHVPAECQKRCKIGEAIQQSQKEYKVEDQKKRKDQMHIRARVVCGKKSSVHTTSNDPNILNLILSNVFCIIL